ncbi:hypothetical protein AX774_g5258 [Zancudomyces culisetae]|uniref:Uncharacterized protein n=1 Tax=Zancudomyces culisetae TaxID=1213189 RepID=A0A1R1PJZ3_ZANCU|nr:hypothetical protein AX774_g5258 [Zancudomyces culisetae]|eukprot:OMH81286.1 hypothetical protein AX774_g5258 [Zancudomyces culisetae]
MGTEKGNEKPSSVGAGASFRLGINSLTDNELIGIFSNLEPEHLVSVSTKDDENDSTSKVVNKSKSKSGSHILSYGDLVATPKKKLLFKNTNSTANSNTGGTGGKVEDIFTQQTAARNTFWKAEYICRSELLNQWRYSYSPTVRGETNRIVRRQCEMGITTVHKIYCSTENNWMLSVSLTQGVCVRSDMNISTFGKIENLKNDLLYCNGSLNGVVDGVNGIENININNNNNNNNVDNDTEVNRQDLRLQQRHQTSTRMQTVVFSTSNRVLKREKQKAKSNTTHSRDNSQKEYHDEPKFEMERLVLVLWGGYHVGCVYIHHLYAKSGKFKKHVTTESRYWHIGSVTSLAHARLSPIVGDLKGKETACCSKLFDLNNTKKSHDSHSCGDGDGDVCDEPNDTKTFELHDYVVSGGIDGTIKIWCMETGKFITQYSCKTKCIITCIKIVANRWIVAGTNVGQVVICDTSLLSNKANSPPLKIGLDAVVYIDNGIGVGYGAHGWTVTDILTNPRRPHLFIVNYVCIETVGVPQGKLCMYKLGAVGNPVTSKSSTTNEVTEIIKTLEFCWEGMNALTSLTWESSSQRHENYSPLGSTNKPKNDVGVNTHKSTDNYESLSDTTPAILAAGDILGNVYLWDTFEDFRSQPTRLHSLGPPPISSARNDVTKTATPMRSLCTGHSSMVVKICYDSLKLVSTSNDGVIIVWEPLIGSILRKIRVRGTKYKRQRYAAGGPTYSVQELHQRSSPNQVPVLSQLENDLFVVESLAISTLSKKPKEHFADSSNFCYPPGFISAADARGEGGDRLHDSLYPFISESHPNYGSLISDVVSTSYDSFVVATCSHLVKFNCSPSLFTFINPNLSEDLSSVVFELPNSPNLPAQSRSHSQPKPSSKLSSSIFTSHLNDTSHHRSGLVGKINHNQIPYSLSLLLYNINYGNTINLSRLAAISNTGTSTRTSLLNNAPNGTNSANPSSGLSSTDKKVVNSEIKTQLALHRTNYELERQQNIDAAETREYLARQYFEPQESLGLGSGDGNDYETLISYAKMLSLEDDNSYIVETDTGYLPVSDSNTCAGTSANASSSVNTGILDYQSNSLSLPLDKDHFGAGENPGSSTNANANVDKDFVLQGLTEEEMLEYALFLSKNA